MTITNFIENNKLNKAIQKTNYIYIRNFILKNEDDLLKKKIIRIEEKGFTKRINIIDSEKLIILLESIVEEREKCVTEFLKTYKLEKQKQSVLKFLKQNKNFLKEKGLIKDSQIDKRVKYVILDFEALYQIIKDEIRI